MSKSFSFNRLIDRLAVLTVVAAISSVMGVPLMAQQVRALPPVVEKARGQSIRNLPPVERNELPPGPYSVEQSVTSRQSAPAGQQAAVRQPVARVETAGNLENNLPAIPDLMSLQAPESVPISVTSSVVPKLVSQSWESQTNDRIPNEMDPARITRQTQFEIPRHEGQEFRIEHWTAQSSPSPNPDTNRDIQWQSQEEKAPVEASDFQIRRESEFPEQASSPNDASAELIATEMSPGFGFADQPTLLDESGLAKQAGFQQTITSGVRSSEGFSVRHPLVRRFASRNVNGIPSGTDSAIRNEVFSQIQRTLAQNGVRTVGLVSPDQEAPEEKKTAEKKTDEQAEIAPAFPPRVPATQTEGQSLPALSLDPPEANGQSNLHLDGGHSVLVQPGVQTYQSGKQHPMVPSGQVIQQPYFRSAEPNLVQPPIAANRLNSLPIAGPHPTPMTREQFWKQFATLPPDDKKARTEGYDSMQAIMNNGFWYGGVDVMYLEPMFQENNAFTTSTGPIATSRHVDFGFDVNFRGYFGFETNAGPAFKASFMRLNNFSAISSVSLGAGQSALTLVDLGDSDTQFQLGSGASPGSRLSVQQEMKINSTELMIYKDQKNPVSRVRGNVGLRHVSLQQLLFAGLDDPVNGSTVVRNFNDYFGAGPKLGIEYFRPIGHTDLELQSGLFGSLLFGRRDQIFDAAGPNALQFQQLGKVEAVSIFEMYIGVQWAFQVNECQRVFFRSALESQLWAGSDSALDVGSDLALYGVTFGFGITR